MVPHQFNSIKKQMSSLLCQYTFSPDIWAPSIAYTESCSESIYGQTNHIYVNNKDKIITCYLFMHEAGHVLFNHTSDIKERIDCYLEKQLKGAFKRCKEIFDESFANFYKFFLDALLNIVMDFEVNSRIFSLQEWKFFQLRLLMWTKDPNFKGMWPEDYGLPVGKTWNEYLSLILLDPENFFEKLREEIRVARAVGEKNKKNYDNKTSEFDGELSQEEYEALKQKMKKRKKFSREDKEFLKKISQNHGEAQFSLPHGSMDGYTRDGLSKPCHVNFTNYVSMPDLVNKMEKLLFVNKRGFTLRNQMYNTNRRKYGTSIIIPKTVKNNQLKKPDLILLFDVSGSIDSYSVHSFIETFKRFKNEFKNTKIIFWAEQYIAEMTLDEEQPNLFGGGTDMAKGIAYIKNRFEINKKDVFFMISDFEDDLDQWERELKTLDCRKLAIDWNRNPLLQNPGFERILKNGQEDDVV